MYLDQNDIRNELKELIDIAEYVLAERQEKGISMNEFLQLIVNIRIGEREQINLSGKNLVILEENVLQ